MEDSSAVPSKLGAHTPEPWTAELTDDPEDGSDAYAVDCANHSIALMDAPGGLALNEANARRIAACVNGLAHTDQKWLESVGHEGVTVALAAGAMLVQQRDELLEALRYYGAIKGALGEPARDAIIKVSA